MSQHSTCVRHLRGAIRAIGLLFLFHAYSFLMMSSISHEELVTIETLKGGPPGPYSDPHRPKSAIFTPFVKFLKICSVTFVYFAHIASLGCLLSARKSWTPLNHSKGVPQAPNRTLLSPNIDNLHTFCQISQNLFSYFFLFRAYCFLRMSSIIHE